MSFPDYSAIFPYGFSTSSATGASLASGGSGASSPSSPVAGAPPSSAMVGPALSGASQLDSADLSDGEDAVAVPKWRSIPVEVDSDGLSDRVGSPSGSPSKVGPGLGPSSLGSPGSPTPSELSRFSSASEIQRREAASQGLTDVLGAHARATLVQGSPSAKASSTVPTGQAFVASAPPSAGLGPPELVYFRPMVPTRRSRSGGRFLSRWTQTVFRTGWAHQAARLPRSARGSDLRHWAHLGRQPLPSYPDFLPRLRSSDGRPRLRV